MQSDDLHKFRASLEAAVAGIGIEPLSGAQYDLMARHYSMMCQWNRRINLTRISKPEEAARMHYAESLFGGIFIGSAATLLDVGSGAGFPGIPVAIQRADLQLTALEANQKKALFLNEVKEELGLANLRVVRARIEEFDWTGFDLLASRALDHAEEVLAEVLKNLNPTQRLMVYCSPDLLSQLILRSRIEHEPRVLQIPHTSSRLVALFSGE